MAKWLRTLNLLPEWEEAKDDRIGRQEMARIISDRLMALQPLGNSDLDWEREEIADRFDDLAHDKDADPDDFNCLMEELYDWADTQVAGKFFDAEKVCWVKTF